MPAHRRGAGLTPSPAHSASSCSGLRGSPRAFAFPSLHTQFKPESGRKHRGAAGIPNGLRRRHKVYLLDAHPTSIATPTELLQNSYRYPSEYPPTFKPVPGFPHALGTHSPCFPHAFNTLSIGFPASTRFPLPWRSPFFCIQHSAFCLSPAFPAPVGSRVRALYKPCWSLVQAL